MERAALCPSITPLPFSAIGGYITVVYDGSCWFGCVLNVNEQEHAITVTFLHPSNPKRRDVLDIDPSDILTHVQPSIATATGRTYTLSKKVVQEATTAYLCNFSFLMVICLDSLAFLWCLCYDIHQQVVVTV